MFPAADLAKIRSLPTPRNVLVVVLGLMLAASVIVLLVAPSGSDAEWYHRAPELAAAIGGTIGAMVLGAWIIGVEFSSKTVRLAATAQPSRLGLIGMKLQSALILLAVYSALILGATWGLGALLSSIGGADFPSGEVWDRALGSTVTSLLWGLFAFGLVLLLKSYTAGLIAAIVLAIGVDNLLQLIPKVGRYTFGSATSAIINSFTGDEMDLALWTAIATAAGWLVAIMALGAARFAARDLK